MKNLELTNLLSDKEKLEEKLNNMIFGTMEIREKDDKKYFTKVVG